MGLPLRKWQQEALASWLQHDRRGIVGAVTGGGKTVFALACIQEVRAETAIIVVPTTALLDQWWEEAAAFFDLALDDINILQGRRRVRRGTINIGVLNTVAKLKPTWPSEDAILIVDECHKAATPEFGAVLDLPADARLGLSATPERPYDDGLSGLLEPKIGPVLYSYLYGDALKDGVIVPFELRNVVFRLEPERELEYRRVTTAIARAVEEHGRESNEAISLYLRRSRILNLSPRRVEIALRIVAGHPLEKIIIFHENIDAATVIDEVLKANVVASGLYHSEIPIRQRSQTLRSFREGSLRVLITCKALDEGFNVPEAEVGIIAASTATRRQRIQRLGRVLRPAAGKERALVYTLVASDPEVARLRAEEAELEGVASVTWVSA